MVSRISAGEAVRKGQMTMPASAIEAEGCATPCQTKNPPDEQHEQQRRHQRHERRDYGPLVRERPADNEQRRARRRSDRKQLAGQLTQINGDKLIKNERY